MKRKARAVCRCILTGAVGGLLLLAAAPAAAAELDITWTGNGNDGLYDNLANWDLGVVPNNDATNTYNVTLFATGDVFMDVDVPCTVTDLFLGPGQNFRIGSGHVYTVLDDAAINGLLTVENSSFLAQTAGASFGDDRNARLIASGGGTISIAAVEYSSAAIHQATTLFAATGTGTTINLSSLESIDADFDDYSAQASAHTISVATGGAIDLSAVQTLVGPLRGEDRLDLVMSSAGFIDLPSLQEIYSFGTGDVRFDLNVPSYALDALLTARDTQLDLGTGTTLSLPLLTTFGGRMDVPVNASISAPSLLEIRDATISVLPGGTFTAPNATTFVNSDLTLEGGQIVTLPAFLEIDASRFRADGGVMFAVAAPAYDNRALHYGVTLIDAQGAGTLLDFSTLTLINDGYDDYSAQGSAHTISAGTGASIDLSGVHTLIGPLRGEDRLDFVMSGDGLIDLFALQEIYSSSAGDVRFELNVPSYTLPALALAADTQFDLMPGTALSLPVLTTFGGRFDVPADASVTAPSLLEITYSTVSVLPDGSFSAPNATTFTSSFLTVEAGQTLNLPVLVNIDHSRFDVRGGVAFAVAAAEYDARGLNGELVVINAQGAGTLVDWSTVGLIDARWDDYSAHPRANTYRALDGGRLDLSNVASLTLPVRTEDRVDFVVTSGGIMDLSSLAAATGAGAVRFAASDTGSFLDLSGYAAFDRPSQLTLTGAAQVRLGGLGVVGSGTFAADDDVSGYPTAIVDGSVRNEITTETSFRTGDLKLTMTAEYGTYEAASSDVGVVDPGPDTFELGELTFTPPPPGECPAMIVFLETFDNGNRDAPLEAVYITGHDGFDAIAALNGGTLVLRGLNVYAYESGGWINLQDLAPPLGSVPYKDGHLANRLEVLAGDINGDRQVSFEDILLVLQAWNEVNPFVDQTGDDLVNFADVLAVLANWGATGCP